MTLPVEEPLQTRYRTMYFREFAAADLPQVRSLYERSGKLFPFPNLSLCPITWVCEDSHEIVAFGMAKLTCEAIIIVDPNINKISQTNAILNLLNIGIQKVREFGLDEIHAFLTGGSQESFAKICRKLGFLDITGIPLVLQVRNNGESSNTSVTEHSTDGCPTRD